MNNLLEPIFKNKLFSISWQKIYEREYGVQYSEIAVSLLAFANYHFPKTSFAQIVVPGQGNNTAFYIDNVSWINLIEGLNKKYTSDVKKLEEYEKQFLFDGKNYLRLAKKISKSNLKVLTNKKILSLFLDYQNKRNRYSCFAWSAFILNNYVADRATAILEPYIKKHHKENKKQEIIDALFKPEKLAAVLQFQYELEKQNGKLSNKQFENLYRRFKWLSCLDIHNKAWTKQEFRENIKSFNSKSRKQQKSFEEFVKELKPNPKDLEYLKMAKRFVYIKDARDDFRRESVYFSNALWQELGERMGISIEETSYLQDKDIINFLKDKNKISKQIITKRKKGFVLYLDINKNLICLDGEDVKKALKIFNLLAKEKTVQKITGSVASKGIARGKVRVVKGVKDLDKVKKGDILVAVSTHPDYVPAMRRASAIITDEGGITSHAAIVSREFGIPCLVGTKIATKALKDGHSVKVDAENGFIEIIK